MKKLLFSVAFAAMILLMGSCRSSKEVAYLQNIDSISLDASRGLYDARIMPKDLLTITVLTTDPAASAPFNLTVSNTVGTSGQLSSSSQSLQGYLVDNSGYINFPIIGKVHVAGLTKNECENLIKSKVQPYLSKSENPIVTVRMSSYRITLLGEVSSPGQKQIATEKVNLLEAIALGGDLTIYGRRDNVLLIREDATGAKKHIRINLTDANLINSPYFYLQQNDIIYVEPNDVKKKNSDIGQSTTMWFSFIGIATSLASLIVSVLRK